MNKTALVLAAHGSRHEPSVNEQVRQWARQVAERTAFDEVAVAFHQGSPAFCDVLDTLEADTVTVVPLMASDGYYSNTVLPRELARNRRFADIAIHQTAPVGLYGTIPQLICDRVRHVRNEANFSADDCTVGLVGHGTPRHPASRNSTIELARKLQGLEFPEVISVFLDDEPKVEMLLKLATRPVLIVVPFLIGAGPHAVVDVPRRIGLNTKASVRLPMTGTIDTKTIFCDMPLGSYPQMVDLILHTALSANRADPPGSFQREVA